MRLSKLIFKDKVSSMLSPATGRKGLGFRLGSEQGVHLSAPSPTVICNLSFRLAGTGEGATTPTASDAPRQVEHEQRQRAR